jgi:hypothetical protein
MDAVQIGRLVEAAYDECLRTAPSLDCPQGEPDGLRTCSSCLHNAYFDLRHPAVDYGCERRRFMYVIRNLPPAVWDTYRLLGECAVAWEELLTLVAAGGETRLRVVSLGCGPGSDLLGTMSWLSNGGAGALVRSGFEGVGLTGLDGDRRWKPLFDRVLEASRPAQGGLADVDVSFGPVGADFAEVAIARPHLLQCSWLWSEFGDSFEATRLWNRVAAALPRPCMVVFTDRTEDRVCRLLDLLVTVTPGEVRPVSNGCGLRAHRFPLTFSPRVEELWLKKNIKSVGRVLMLR